MSKLHHKDLKHRDAFAGRAEKVIGWVASNGLWVFGSVGAVFASVLLVWAGTALARRHLESNFARLDEAMKVARAEVGGKTVRSLEELNEPVNPDELRFETEEDKWKAFAKELDAVEPKLSRQAPEAMAAFYKGEAQYQLKNYVESIQGYEKYARTVEKDPFFYRLALYNLAVARMDAGDFAKALDDLKKARTVGQGPGLGSVGAALLTAEALCEARLGKLDDARQTLDDLSSQYGPQADGLGVPVLKAALEQKVPGAFGEPIAPPAQAPAK